MGKHKYRDGYVGRFFDVSYSPDLTDRWDFYESLDDAKESLVNRYVGYDTFQTCKVSDRGMVTDFEEESSRFPAVTTGAEIFLYRVVNDRAFVGDYPYRVIRLNEDGDPYVDDC